MRNRLFKSEDVQRGVDRFMDDFRASFGYDAAVELVEPCKNGCGYPAAYLGECFTCIARASRTLPA